MDQNEFLATQWLKDETDDTGISNAREGISAHFQWGDSNWYESDDRLADLFAWLNSDEAQLADPGRTRKQLLDDLGALSGESEREPWITSVEREAFWSIPENRYQEPARSDDYEMNYRYDQLYEVYEWEDPAVPGVWMSQEEADARMHGWAQQEGVQYEYSDPIWDENWEMLYRTNAAGIYEYAYSDDKVSIRPGTEWLSYAQVMQTAETPAPAAAAEPMPESLAEQIAVSRSAALEQTITQIRETGLSQEAISDEQIAELFDQYVLDGLRAQQQ